MQVAVKGVASEQSDVALIEQTVWTYLDGLYHSDVEKLKASFHPDSHLYCAVSGKLEDLPASKWFEVVSTRPSPASKGEPRHDRIVSIDLNGPVTAFVKVECAVPPRYFTDYLTLIKLDGAWKVIAKAYDYVKK